MKSFKPHLLFLSLTLTTAGTVAMAQASPGPDDAGGALPRYTVEMIIFEYAEDVGLGSEIFVPAQEGAGDDAPDIAGRSPTGSSSPETGRNSVDLGIRTLRRSELTMNDTFARLERLDAYRPLMYFGWTQATVPEASSPELPLARFGAPPAGLDGELRLYLNRFLHLVVDVSKLAPPGSATLPSAIPATEMDSDRTAADRGRPLGIASDGMYEPLRYRISEDRIMKNGEIRYYDHPKFGVVAKVTRVGDDGVSAGL